ncbi:UL36 very large tegument protein [Streptomyces sp. NPDC007861]|uniref:UL36 very large tegument protein n=1 Tax=Streptomyces sp. NPDC007861 TaxID=3154893 RepID=UPI0033D1D9D4
MAVYQLPVEVRAFAQYLRELTERLDRDGGWYGVFWQRDPDGIVACLKGAEVPPWDVVESLLDDLAAAGDGEDVHRRRTAQGRPLHASAAAAHDRRPGGREALRQRLELMRREQAHAMERGDTLLRQLAAVAEDSPEYQRLANELSWTNDDHTRATARVAELAARIGALPADTLSDPHPQPGWSRPRPGSGQSAAAEAAPGEGAGLRAAPASGLPGVPASGVSAEARTPEPGPAGDPYVPSPAGFPDAWFRDGGTGGGSPAEEQAEAGGPAQAPRRRGGAGKRRPRGARYAWLDVEDDDGERAGAGEAVAVPVLPVADVRPRGARFGGGEREQDTVTAEPAAASAAAHRAATETVAALLRLRAGGRSGEAHALLCEAAVRPSGWLPVLAAELNRAGLGADWATLLWEAASLPPERLAEAAGALAAAGRPEDCGQLLRQGVARPAAEIAHAVLALTDAGGRSEADALLAAFVRARTPEDAAQLAATDPRRLVPHLLSAARAVSGDRERDLAHALRVAGFVSA